LTAAKVAKAMYEAWWSPHGVPSVITSDRGAHFAGAWWRTMCAMLGVRQAYAQAYHHPANGRAEVAGAQLQKRLRKRRRVCAGCRPCRVPSACCMMFQGQLGSPRIKFCMAESGPTQESHTRRPTHHPMLSPSSRNGRKWIARWPGP
jgi:hypothetical protein